MTVLDLHKQQPLDTDPKAIVAEEAKETNLHFLKETVIVLWMCFAIYFALI